MNWFDFDYNVVFKNYWAILTFTIFMTYFVSFLLQRALHRFFLKTNFIELRKEQTIESLFKSVTNYAALTIIIIVAVSPFVELTKVLAGAGVLGIILGFGAQSVIKDILTGFFLIYEKQLHKGDFITINEKYHGTVEEIGLRVIKVREWSGRLLTIANGEVKEILNYNIEKMRVIEKAVVSFREDPDKVFKVLESVCDELNEQFNDALKRDVSGNIIEKFQLYGITSLNANNYGYEYTVIGLVNDQVYWTAAKETRRAISKKFYENSIRMPETNVIYSNLPTDPA
jgi:small-conductance mechanosensitive channel